MIQRQRKPGFNVNFFCEAELHRKIMEYGQLHGLNKVETFLLLLTKGLEKAKEEDSCKQKNS